MTEIWRKDDGTVYGGRSIVLGACRIFNPSAAQLAEAGYKKYIMASPPADMDMNEYYKAKVVELIRERYDINKEMEIQREMLDALLNSAPTDVDDTDAGTTDVVVNFNVYNDYVEECKRRAKELLTAIEPSRGE